MNMRTPALALALTALTGCASLDGKYQPDCEAYAGDIITLEGDTFRWEKFTDAVKVDEDGNRIDPFPGFPMQGSYAVDGNKVFLVAADRQSVELMFLHRESGDRQYLLTPSQYEVLVNDGERHRCALVRQAEPSTGEN